MFGCKTDRPHDAIVIHALGVNGTEPLQDIPQRSSWRRGRRNAEFFMLRLRSGSLLARGRYRERERHRKEAIGIGIGIGERRGGAGSKRRAT